MQRCRVTAAQPVPGSLSQTLSARTPSHLVFRLSHCSGSNPRTQHRRVASCDNRCERESTRTEAEKLKPNQSLPQRLSTEFCRLSAKNARTTQSHLVNATADNTASVKTAITFRFSSCHQIASPRRTTLNRNTLNTFACRTGIQTRF